MALLTIFKEHKLLLGATAILSVGSVAAAWAAGGGVIAGGILLAKFAESLSNSMTAANLGDLAKKLRDSSQVLTNKDLTKAAGRAIILLNFYTRVTLTNVFIHVLQFSLSNNVYA